MKTLKGLHEYYAIICDDSKYTPKKMKANKLICGVYSTRKEAVEAEKEIKDCMCPHVIKKCSVTIQYEW